MRYALQDDFIRIVELTPALRREIRATIRHLVAILDRFDEDGGASSDGHDAFLGGEDYPDLL